MRKSRFIEHLGPDQPHLPEIGLTGSSSMFTVASENQDWPLRAETRRAVVAQPSMTSINSQTPLFRSVPDLEAIEREQDFHEALLCRAQAAEAARSRRSPRRLPSDIYARSQVQRAWLPRLQHARDVVFWIAFVFTVASLVTTIALIPVYAASKSEGHQFTLISASLCFLTGAFMMLLCSDTSKSAWLSSIGVRETGELNKAIREQRAIRNQQDREGIGMQVLSYENGRRGRVIDDEASFEM